MTRIAFLGLGAMGARMAARCLAAGHAVTVWNRSPGPAAPLKDQGAGVAGSPAEAAASAEIVISMLRDDEASRAVWLAPQTGALHAMAPGTLAIESSTLTPGWIAELGAAADAAGVAFLDAPVAGSRPQAEAGQLIYFVGGGDADLARAQGVLGAMGGTVHHAGPRGAGAMVKLAVNSLFGLQLAGLAELIGLLDRSGVDPAQALDIIGAVPVCSPAAKAASGAMLAGNFAPAFPIELVEKDFGYVAAAATQANAAIPLAEATRAVFAKAMTAGHGAENITGVVQLYR